MSHVADVDLEVTDLAAYAKAVEAMGGTFDPEATRIKWFGKFLNDWQSNRAAVNRIDAKRFGTTDAGEARFPGCNYSVGLLKNENGSYTPYYDTWGESGGLTRVMGGPDCPRLKDEYAAAVAERVARRNGYRVTRTTNAKGEIVLKAYN